MKKSWKRVMALGLSFVLMAGSVNISMASPTEMITMEPQKEGVPLATDSDAERPESPIPPGRPGIVIPDATPSDATASDALRPVKEAQDTYALSSDFYGTQGPVWYYKYEDVKTKQILELPRFDASVPRWMDEKNQYIRVFQDGMMPGNNGSDAVLEWKAPAKGLIQILDETGIISMEEPTKPGRDGVSVSVQKNEKTVWPDQGALSTEFNKTAVEVQPFYLQVDAGDRIHFRTNGNREFNNDRTKWLPMIRYIDESVESPVLITDLRMTSAGSLEVTTENLMEEDLQDRISLSAIVDGKAAIEVPVVSAEAEGDQVSVTFEPVTAAQNSIIQLSVGIDEDHRFVTYSPQAFGEVSDKVFYVDAEKGSDDYDGLSENTPWKSLEKVNATTFLPGETILLKAGGIWNGYLYPKGSGSEGAPITLGKYGGDGYPIINGDGSVPYDDQYKAKKDHVYAPAVLLSDQSYWVIDGLEVTNRPNDDYNHAGILLFTTGQTGVVSDITVTNCYVHDVTAKSSNSKLTGGILVVGADAWIDGQKPTAEMESEIGFHDILIENNYVKNVAKEGIRSTGQSTKDGGGFRNTKKHKNVVFRGNYIEEIFGDGIVLAEVGEGGLVENNVVKNHCNYEDANYAGAWLWQCNDSVFRYNEVFGGKYGYNDGEAFDYDIGCKDIVYEYNYSHNNKGGLLLIMYSDSSYHFRYNISANDGKASQELFHCATGGSKIYNNTMYIGKGVTTSIFDNGAVGYFKNNIVLAHGNVPKFSTSPITAAKGGVTNNIFYPASMAAVNGPSANVLEDNLFVNPRLSSPQVSSDYKEEEYDLTYENMGQGDEFIDGLRTRMEMFKLRKDSPAIDGGEVIGTVDIDIFGNTITGTPDIGAHEFNDDEGPVVDDGKKVEKVSLDKIELFMEAGETISLKAVVTPEDVLDDGLIWSTSDDAVVTVSAAGKITGAGSGTAIVKAVSLNNPEAFAQCMVHVYEKDVNVIPADKDARVRDDGTSSGTEEAMYIKKDSGGYNRKVLMSFDLSTMPNEYQRVLLKFHVDTTEANDVPFTISRTSDGWEEMTVKWATAPVSGEKILDFRVGTADVGTWKEYDMTDYIKEMDAAGDKRLSIVFEGVNSGGKNWVTINSRETDYKPQLVFSNETIESADPVFIQTAVGKAPAMPETVKIHYYDGTSADVAVVWDEIPEDRYQSEGQIAVKGTVEGWSVPVIAYVTVSDQVICEVYAEDVKTPAGVAPILPEYATAVYINGDKRQVAVSWEEVSKGSYQKPGEFQVKGKIAGYSQGCAVKVIVTEAEIVEMSPVTVTGYVGFMPVLSETVETRFTDGSKQEIPVIWGTIKEELYQVPGTFEVEGRCEGTELKAVANVMIIEAVTKTAEIKSPAGKYPVLPKTVELDMSKVTTARKAGAAVTVPVVWEPVKKELYQGQEPYKVQGYLVNTTIPAELEVTPSAAVEPQSGSLETIGDTYIQAAPSDSKNGGEPVIRIKNYTGSFKRIGLVKFDLGELYSEELTSMELKLYFSRMDEGTSSETYLNVYTTSPEWEEAAASYDSITQGAGYKERLIREHVVIERDQVGSFITIDVSDALADIRQGTIAFVLDMETNPEGADGSKTGIEFISKEGDAQKAPQLLVSNQYVSEIEEIKTECKADTEPELPDTIRIRYSDGTEKEAAVIWDQISTTLLGKEGMFLVRGTVEGLYCNVSAWVKVEQGGSTGPEEPEEPEEPDTPEKPSMKKDRFRSEKTPECTWIRGLNSMKCRLKNGEYAANGWYNLDYSGVTGWYRFDENGYAVAGFFNDTDGNTYFLGKEYEMLCGWQLLDGTWYYFNTVSDGTKGAMYRNRTTPDGYVVNADGAWMGE